MRARHLESTSPRGPPSVQALVDARLICYRALMVEGGYFRDVVADVARERRNKLGYTQDGVARRCSTLGFETTRGVIDAIERGARELELPELLVLFAVLEMSFEDVLGAGTIKLASGADVPAQTLLAQARGRATRWTVSSGGRSWTVDPVQDMVKLMSGSFEPHAHGDVERKAAKKLQVAPAVILEASGRLWGRSLADERDTRVATQLPPNQPGARYKPFADT